jgi:hypothetical protein
VIGSERKATCGPRSTIARRAAISLSPKSIQFARHRVRRCLDYPAALGLDRAVPVALSWWCNDGLSAGSVTRRGIPRSYV